jgi:phenylalanyl-tRNA synthetase beta chain
MKAPLSWLKEFVEIDLSPADLAELLTRHGAEVESILPLAPAVPEAVAGKVLSCRPDGGHAGWNWCEVSIGKRTLLALCGAPNIRPGLTVPVALPGMTIFGGKTVEEKRFGEAVSAGVLLSEMELGVGDDHSGVMALDPAVAAGTKLAEALSLADWVLDVAVTPNRSDLMSVRGIAREISALLRQPLRRRKIRIDGGGAQGKPPAEVSVLDYRLCPRYCARVIAGVAIGPSPFVVRRRLALCGVRPINNVVDATNYVMLSVGQPLHAFDLGLLQERTIRVRTAGAGEEIVTIDGDRRALSPSMLVIADARRPVAVAGVMGGKESEVGEGTTDLLLESACFHPASVRSTSRTLGVSSEASRRFERSVDPNLAPEALDLLVGMILNTAGGKAVGGRVDCARGPFRKRTVRLSPKRTSELIGVNFTAASATSLLKRLGLRLESRREDSLSFSVPTFRPDLKRDVDLMEEIARLYGYDRIPETVPLRPLRAPPLNPGHAFQQEIRAALVGLGLSEAITLSFSSLQEPERMGFPEGHPERSPVPILNPVNKEQGCLRNSLLPGLLRVISRNQNRGVETAAVFELGTVFRPLAGEASPREELRLGIALSRPGEDPSWNRSQPAYDFFTLRGIIDGLFAHLKVVGAEFGSDGHPSFRTGQTARIDLRGARIAAAGAIADRVLEAYDLSGPVLAAEISLAPLAAARSEVARYQALPIYPAVRRDIAIIVPEDLPSAHVRTAIEALRPSLLEEYRLFDVYRGAPIPAGEKSLAFSLHYRSRCDTLSEDTVAAVHAAFKESLARKLSCRYRE